MREAFTRQLSRPVVGVGVVVLQGSRALLVRRANPPRAGEWSLPGGRQQWGETVEEAARRELFEETGLRADSLHLLDVVDGILRDREDAVAHHFTLIDFWTEIAADAAREAMAGDDAAQLHWAVPMTSTGLSPGRKPAVSATSPSVGGRR